MSNKMMIILGMMMVTFIPRLLPFYLVSGKKLPKRLRLFLELIPYTALGALIIPGAINAIPDAPLAGLAGLLFAAGYSFFKGSMILTVVGSIACVYMIMLL